MNKLLVVVVSLAVLSGCMTDKHNVAVYPQKIVSAVSAKYPNEKNTLMFVDAPEGFIAPRFATTSVADSINTGRVAAIVSSLALKTSTVIVAGENEALTAATLERALFAGREKIAGSKVIVIGSQETQKALTVAAAASNVSLEFMDNPH